MGLPWSNANDINIVLSVCVLTIIMATVALASRAYSIQRMRTEARGLRKRSRLSLPVSMPALAPRLW